MSVSLSLLFLSTLAHNGDQLVRVQTPTAQDADTLEALGLDVWTEGSGGPWLDVRLRPGEQALLDLTGLDYTLRALDLGPAVQEERLRLSGPVVHGGMPPEDFFSDYAPIEEIEAHLESLVTLRPDLVTASSPGSSFDGRALRVLQISAADDDAPVVLINGGQHAREWIAVAATTCLADRLVRDADTPRVAAALEQVRFVVIPVVNPDGYAHTWATDGDRFWRKNRRPPEGVDLNRNFPVAFGGPGASGNPEAGNYHGDAPFSEPEAAAMRDLVDGLDPLLALIDVHAYGQLVLYPWGFELDAAPDDDILAPAAQTLTEGLAVPWGSEYVAIPGAELYPAAGNIMDWAYGERGAYAYGIELRPGPDAEPPFGFILPPEDIIPVCDELFEGVMGFTELVAKVDPPGAGDDGGASGGDGTSSSTGRPPKSEGTAGATSSSSGGLSSGTGGGAGSTSAGSTGAPSDTSVEGSDSTGEEASAAESDAGCGCRSSGPGPAAMLWGLLLFVRRRR
ncbi:MAG: hypothetical protein KUG77_09005 [Nannocystaceae bacterium]|nr:hypothetical protein [Nannocystaceae bacterium]